jgi:hypothetical protein
MAGCPYERKPVDCARRQHFVPQPNDCRKCDFLGRQVPGDTKPAPAETTRANVERIRPGMSINPPPPHETPQPKKEEKSVKEKVLAMISRRGPVTSQPILSNLRMKAEELKQITKELSEEKKIRVWEKGRMVIFTVFDAPDPRAAETSNNQQQRATSRSIRGRSGSAALGKGSPRGTQAGLPQERPIVELPAEVFPPGHPIYKQALDYLRRRREVIDQIIRTIEEVVA